MFNPRLQRQLQEQVHRRIPARPLRQVRLLLEPPPVGLENADENPSKNRRRRPHCLSPPSLSERGLLYEKRACSDLPQGLVAVDGNKENIVDYGTDHRSYERNLFRDDFVLLRVSKEHTHPFGVQGINRTVGAGLQDFGLQISKERSHLKEQIPEKISVGGNMAHTLDKFVVLQVIPPVHDDVILGIVQGRVETTQEGDCHNKALDTRGGCIAVGSSQGEILVVFGGQWHETVLHTRIG